MEKNEVVPGFWSGSEVGNQFTMPFKSIDMTDSSDCDGSIYGAPATRMRSGKPWSRCGEQYDLYLEKYIPPIEDTVELVVRLD